MEKKPRCRREPEQPYSKRLSYEVFQLLLQIPIPEKCKEVKMWTILLLNCLPHSRQPEPPEQPVLMGRVGRKRAVTRTPDGHFKMSRSKFQGPEEAVRISGSGTRYRIK